MRPLSLFACSEGEDDLEPNTQFSNSVSSIGSVSQFILSSQLVQLVLSDIPFGPVCQSVRSIHKVQSIQLVIPSGHPGMIRIRPQEPIQKVPTWFLASAQWESALVVRGQIF